MRFTATLLFVFLLLAAGSCGRKRADAGTNRGFYYWKTGFELPVQVRQTLKDLRVRNLYLKVFDVNWQQAAGQAIPVALHVQKEPFPAFVEITPVVFITVEALRNTPAAEIESLAGKIGGLLQKFSAGFKNQWSGEVQIDCDWTAQTKESYFSLLNALKKQSWMAGKLLSVTIRLHQVKYLNEAGVPPACRGLLMCYNMGNLRDPAAGNSIIDPETFKAYTGRLNDYPLPLDFALPLFEWWVWFRNHKYYGLIHAGNLPVSFTEKSKTVFPADTMINGYHFQAGDVVRFENSPAVSIEKIIEILESKKRLKHSKLLLYHLDSSILSKYSLHEIEDFFRPFD